MIRSKAAGHETTESKSADRRPEERPAGCAQEAEPASGAGSEPASIPNATALADVRVLGAVSSQGRGKLKRPSLKERPEKPIPRTPSPMRQGNALRRRTASGQGGGPNRRSAQPHGGRASRDRGASKDAAKQSSPKPAQMTSKPQNAKPRQGNALRRRTASGQGGGPNRRSALPHGGRASRRAITGTDKARREAQPKPEAASAKPEAPICGCAQGANAPADAPADSDTAAAEPQTRAAPVISIESDVDPESWAEYGGWYRQDYAIFYRPTGHKDKFIYSWLFLTGPQAPKGDKSPAAAVFDFLTEQGRSGVMHEMPQRRRYPGQGAGRQFLPAFGREQTGTLHEFHP